jgi:hypothetical protein
MRRDIRLEFRFVAACWVRHAPAKLGALDRPREALRDPRSGEVSSMRSGRL